MLRRLQLTGHALLDYSAGRFWFLFPFVFDYLRARVISRWLYSNSNTNSAEKALRACAGQPGSLLDGAAQLSLSTATESWITAAQRRNGLFELDRLALCGFFHFIGVLAKASNLGERRDVTRALSTIFGKGDTSCFKELYLAGGVSNLDLRNLSFRSCEFGDLEFTKCTFDKSTHFIGCTFSGRLIEDGCTGFGAVDVDLSCILSAHARSTFQSAQVHGIKPDFTKAQLDNAAYDILHRFTRGSMGFLTRKQEGILVAAKRAAPFGTELLRTLLSEGALESFVSRSIEMLRVKETRGVRVFLQNGLKIGSVNRALLRIARELHIQTTSAIC